MSIRVSTINGIVMAGGIVGFPLVAATTSLLDMPSTTTSIVMRALIGSGALLLLLTGRRSITGLIRTPAVLLLYFWLFYILRLLVETLFQPEELARPAFIYWTFAVGACLVPMVALAANRERMAPDHLFRLILVLCVVATLLGLASADTKMGDGEYAFDTGRYGLDSLNPIFFGHLGVTVAVMAIWRLHEKATLKAYLLYAMVAALGILVMLLSASRGPLIAFAASILALEVVRGWRRLLLVGLTLAPLFVFLTFDLTSVDRALGTQTFSRLQLTFEISDAATLGRVQSLGGALQQFIEAPISGNALEERTTRNYPHNIVLEALIATGIFGALALVMALVWLLRQTVRLLQARSPYGWLALLFVQYLVGAQMSGAVWSSYQLWTLCGALIALAPVVQTLRTTESPTDIRCAVEVGAPQHCRPMPASCVIQSPSRKNPLA